MIKIQVEVNGSHVHKGKCGESNKCAIALAMLEAGFKDVQVFGSSASVGAKVPGVRYKEGVYKSNKHVSESLEVKLGVKAENFVTTFDNITVYDNKPLEDKKRNKLAEKLDKKPLRINIELTRRQAEKFLVRDAYRAIPASVRAAA